MRQRVSVSESSPAPDVHHDPRPPPQVYSVVGARPLPSCPARARAEQAAPPRAARLVLIIPARPGRLPPPCPPAGVRNTLNAALVAKVDALLPAAAAAAASAQRGAEGPAGGGAAAGTGNADEAAPAASRSRHGAEAAVEEEQLRADRDGARAEGTPEALMALVALGSASAAVAERVEEEAAEARAAAAAQEEEEAEKMRGRRGVRGWAGGLLDTVFGEPRR